MILADSTGDVLVNNYSRKNFQTGNSQWFMTHLDPNLASTELQVSQIVQKDQKTQLFLTKLTCLNLMVFDGYVANKRMGKCEPVPCSKKTKEILTEILTSMAASVPESLQELNKRTMQHGAQTVLKFLNSKRTGAKDALDLDQRFHEVVVYPLNSELRDESL